MNRIKFAFGFFISGALLGLFYNLLNDKIHHKEECTASLVVFKGNTQTNLTLNFMYSLDESGNDSNLLIVFYVQIMPDDLVMQLHRF